MALDLREAFSPTSGLQAFPKTSGSKGMQVLRAAEHAGVTNTDTRAFSRGLAQLLERRSPDRVVSDMSKAKRGGKVFVDWSQNDRHKTTVNVYSLRAMERPMVSTPLSWDEVSEVAGRRRGGVHVGRGAGSGRRYNFVVVVEVSEKICRAEGPANCAGWEVVDHRRGAGVPHQTCAPR